MDVNTASQLIGSLGFPIACTIIMIVVFYKVITQMSSTHKEEIAKLTEALQNNTKAITELREKIIENGKQ